jgi:hypothetical protein
MFQIAPYGHEVSGVPIGYSILEYSFMSRSFSLPVFDFITFSEYPYLYCLTYINPIERT